MSNQNCQRCLVTSAVVPRAAIPKKQRTQIVPSEGFESRILTIRGQKVILDADLAAIYGVTVKRLNEQVKCNAKPIPPDFMFQLTKEEHAALRSQFATLKAVRGHHRKFLPFTFTENGAVMAANVLNSPRTLAPQLLRASHESLPPPPSLVICRPVRRTARRDTSARRRPDRG